MSMKSKYSALRRGKCHLGRKSFFLNYEVSKIPAICKGHEKAHGIHL
jgi:hypothetical protein